jgi:feruloyl esterase
MLRSLAVRLRAIRYTSISLVTLFALSVFSTPIHAEICESLTSLKLPHTTIALARVEEGDLSSIDNGTLGGSLNHLPSFCRVAGTISPVPDSVIKFEVWMPTSGWNHRFMAVGNGGFSGGPWYRFMAGAVREGYAAAGTDTGHQGSGTDASFALGHPEKVVDFGYRSVHETTVKAKAIIASFYDAPAAKSYWSACSSGGRQGLMEAQRYPADFDGIIAGAPANHVEHLSASAIWIGQATHLTPASYLSDEKLAILHQAALDACDASDGVKDGVIGNPFSCRFDPAVTQCKGEDTSSCLVPEQVEAARKIYAGPVNPRTHQQIFPGLEPGSEITWSAFGGAPEPPIASSHFKYIIFKDPKWDFRSLNFDTDIAIAEKVDGGTLTATNPDLKPFFARGGKLILYHGLTDGLIAPQNTIDYYKAVLKASGPAAVNSMRLYLAPGMNHCYGGAGPSDFDLDAPLAAWVEDKKIPGAIAASHYPPGPPTKPDRTRPLCPYPELAKYKGAGSTDDAENFVCTKPRP